MPASDTFSSANRTGPDLAYGWQAGAGSRGTIDILWSCASTIFICVWVMLHLNVPSSSDSTLTLITRKIKWFVMAMLAPELVMLFASGQWAAAHRSVVDMSGLHPKWTLAHAFYAESGGFWFQPREGVGFPVTAKQLHYLVANGYIKAPTISSGEIWDKSKADRFAKFVAGLQGAWFVLQMIARAGQHLAVSLLELSTLCLLTCTVATLCFWFHKPLDARTPIVVYSKSTMAEILIAAGNEAEKPFKDTPLDFAEDLEYSSTRFPLNKLWGEQARPLGRIPNDRDSLLHSWKILLAVSVPTAAFGCLQLVAWNFSFPTYTEHLLWRWTCVANAIVLGVGCILEASAIVISGYTVSGLHTFNDYKLRWPWNLMFLVPGFMYLTARMIVMVEVMISLRALPASCFVNVEWTNFLPHV